MLGQGSGASWLFWPLFIKFLRPKSLNEKPKSNDSCLAQTDSGSWLSEYFGLGKLLTHLCLDFPVWQIKIIKHKWLGADWIKIWLHNIRCRSNTSVYVIKLWPWVLSSVATYPWRRLDVMDTHLPSAGHPELSGVHAQKHLSPDSLWQGISIITKFIMVQKPDLCISPLRVWLQAYQIGFHWKYTWYFD